MINMSENIMFFGIFFVFKHNFNTNRNIKKFLKIVYTKKIFCYIMEKNWLCH